MQQMETKKKEPPPHTHTFIYYGTPLARLETFDRLYTAENVVFTRLFWTSGDV